jgi:hypothetical protein
MGGEAMAAPCAVVVVAGGITLVCPMPPAPLDDHHDLLLGVPDGRPHLVPRVPHLWGLNVSHDVREDLRGTLWAAPIPLSHTPRLRRLQERYGPQAGRWRLASRLLGRWFQGRRERRARWAVRPQPARGRAKRHRSVSSA